MANFLPLKNYMFYVLDRMMAQYPFASPFLDVGCGNGDLIEQMALRGFEGKGIDYSDQAIEAAKSRLNTFSNIKVEKKSLFDLEHEKFNTIFLWDVLEHIEDDDIFLEKISSFLSPGGHLLLSLPSNQREWRWDDDFYGHYRRYSPESIKAKMIKNKLKPLMVYDFTYPFFWLLRRVYTHFKSGPLELNNPKEIRTKMSSTVNAWDIPIISFLLNKSYYLWLPIYFIQYSFFKKNIYHGCEMFVLARKE